jgi:hypothetical protein
MSAARARAMSDPADAGVLDAAASALGEFVAARACLCASPARVCRMF